MIQNKCSLYFLFILEYICIHFILYNTLYKVHIYYAWNNSYLEKFLRLDICPLEKVNSIYVYVFYKTKVCIKSEF